MNATLPHELADFEESDAPLSPTHAVIDGRLYRHANAKRSPKHGRPYKRPQVGDIEREPYDRQTGHHLHWRPCDREARCDTRAFAVWDDPNRERPADGVYHLDRSGEFVLLLDQE